MTRSTGCRHTGESNFRLAGLLILGMFWLVQPMAWGQQLDMDILPARMKPASGQPAAKKVQPAKQPDSGSAGSVMGKPLSATISKTLYLPPDMYGQWSVTGTLQETNAQEFFSPVVNDIWVLERVGNQVMISNPANGASAAVSVDRVEGNQATFHRQGPAGRNRFFQEIPTISVSGDVLVGRSVNKIQYIKNGQVSREYYAVYGLQATRIGAARTLFKPEEAWQEPDIEIEEIR
jgi:hypothetical protein